MTIHSSLSRNCPTAARRTAKLYRPSIYTQSKLHCQAKVSTTFSVAVYILKTSTFFSALPRQTFFARMYSRSCKIELIFIKSAAVGGVAMALGCVLWIGQISSNLRIVEQWPYNPPAAAEGSPPGPDAAIYRYTVHYKCPYILATKPTGLGSSLSVLISLTQTTHSL